LHAGTEPLDSSRGDDRVLHIIYSMKQGGAERLVLDAAIAQSRSDGQSGRFPAVVVCWNHEGALAGKLKDAGIPVTCLDRRLRPIWKVPFFLMDLRRLVRDIRALANEHRVRILHGHLVDGIVLAALTARATGLPSVGTVYSNHIIPFGIKRGSLKYKAWHRATRWGLNRVDHVVTVSKEATQSLIEQFGVPANRASERPVVVTPVPKSHSRAEARAIFGVSEQTLCLVFVGRLVANKNQADLVRAVALLKERGLSVRLLLTGEGPDAERLSELSEQLGVGDDVSLLGLYDDLPAVLHAADMFVSASISEGVSLALLEAMSAGVPIVSTPAEGNAELLQNGVGTLSKAKSAASLADAVADLWADKNAMHEQAQRAHSFYEEGYSGAKALESDNRIYDLVLERGAGT